MFLQSNHIFIWNLKDQLTYDIEINKSAGLVYKCQFLSYQDTLPLCSLKDIG